MACESWKANLDAYLDGELSETEMRAFDVHLRTCVSCAAQAFSRLQLKRAVQTAGKRFTPSPEFRKRFRQNIPSRAQPRLLWAWTSVATAFAVVLVVALAWMYVIRTGSRTDAAYSEIADLHVSTLASSSPVDVVSSDRHTVKPWFQGRIPFTFDLPELQNSEFTLIGGRITYLDQTPGAQLIYQIRKHRISVFIFPEDPLKGKFHSNPGATRILSFPEETWSQRGLRYFLIGDASRADLHNLAELFKKTSP
jgi:anti-sigma factor RsiW